MVKYGSFVGSLIRDEVPAASATEFEALLHWLAGRRNDAAASMKEAFDAHDVSSEAARHHALRYLDHSLFRHQQDYYRLFGLKPDCSFSAIRARHKQLLQTFHPDRHSDDQDWFTMRTEQLNRAYAYLKSNHGKPRSTAASPRPAARPTPDGTRTRRAEAPRATKRWKSAAAYKVWLRRNLKMFIGNPARFERRLYIVLYSVPAILFLIVYLNQLEVSDGAEGAGDSAADSRMPVKYHRADDGSDSAEPPGKRETVTPRPANSALQFRAAPDLRSSTLYGE